MPFFLRAPQLLHLFLVELDETEVVFAFLGVILVGVVVVFLRVRLICFRYFRLCERAQLVRQYFVVLLERVFFGGFLGSHCFLALQKSKWVLGSRQIHLKISV